MMDNQEIEHYMAASRIRTCRRRKRDALKQHDKQLLQYNRKKKELWQAWNQRGYTELDPPVMKGYKRYFVLREDVARSRDGEFFQELLKKINTYDYSHRKDFKVKKRRRGRKVHVLREQQLLQPAEYHFKKMKLTSKEINCFEERVRYCKNGIDQIKYFVVKEPWRFVLQVRPNMITKQRVTAPELRSEMDQLDNFLKQNQLEHKIWSLTRSQQSSQRRWLPECKVKYRFKQYTLRQLLQEEWYE